MPERIMRISEVVRKEMFNTESILHDIVVVVMYLNGSAKDEWELYHGNVRSEVALWVRNAALASMSCGCLMKEALRLVISAASGNRVH
jgi:hypothetical protein